MSFEVKGKLYEFFETQQVTDSFKKREFVLEVEDGSYTQYVKFQMTQDRCDLLNSFTKGEDMTVSFSLAGRPYTNAEGQTIYFTNLSAWRLAKDEMAQAAPAPMPTQAQAPAVEDNADDLPF